MASSGWHDGSRRMPLMPVRWLVRLPSPSARMPRLAGRPVHGAQATARANVVWGVPPSVVVGGLNGLTDVAVEACPDRPAHQCVRTDVYRTTGRGNPLPTDPRPPGGDRHAGRAGDGDRRGEGSERVELRAALGHCGSLARRQGRLVEYCQYPHLGRRSRRLHASKRKRAGDWAARRKWGGRVLL